MIFIFFRSHSDVCVWIKACTVAPCLNTVIVWLGVFLDVYPLGCVAVHVQYLRREKKWVRRREMQEGEAFLIISLIT